MAGEITDVNASSSALIKCMYASDNSGSDGEILLAARPVALLSLEADDRPDDQCVTVRVKSSSLRYSTNIMTIPPNRVFYARLPT